MKSWNPLFYRPDSRLHCPLVPTIPAFSVRFAHARQVDREAMIGMYQSARNLTQHWRESLAGDPWTEPEYHPSPNRALWYEHRAPMGLGEIYLAILHEWTYDQRAAADACFALEMEQVAEERNLNTKYDVYLVFGVAVRQYDLSPTDDRETIRGLAMVEIQQRVIDYWDRYDPAYELVNAIACEMMDL